MLAPQWHELARDLEAFFVEEVEDVRARLGWAERVDVLTIQRFEARWAEACTGVRDAHGIELSSQTGLVPIGANPVTGLWEFYHLRSAWDPHGEVDPADLPIPTHRADGSIEVAGTAGIVFVLLPGGTFTMGAQREDPSAPNHDPLAEPDETPHEETLTPFFLARHELTQGQWMRLTGGTNPSNYKPGFRLKGVDAVVTLGNPVELVSWNECRELLGHQGLALPSEAQWEYACRAGTDTPWHTGRTPESLNGVANILDETAKAASPAWVGETYFRDGHVVHAPVGSFAPNGFGLYDMHGNVWEWCADPYPGSTYRVNRGGSLLSPARYARAANRASLPPHVRHDYLGVRAARPVHP